MRDFVPMRIGLFDAMGTGNLGDAAIQDVVIDNIRSRLPQAQIVGFSYVPSDTVDRHGIPCHPIARNAPGSANPGGRATRVSTLKSVVGKAPLLRRLARPVANAIREGLFLRQSYKTLRQLDLLIMSGGGQLCELWGGPWAHPYSLFKFSILAKLARKRLYFLNVGAEPLEHRLSRFFTRSAVRVADYVSLRDDYSQKQVHDHGSNTRILAVADPAYALDVNRYRNGRSDVSSPPTAGINPIGYCDPRIWPRKQQTVYDAYIQKLTQFSVWLLQQGYRLKIFTTSPAADRYAVVDLKRKILEATASLRPSVGMAPGAAAPTIEEALCRTVSEVLGTMSGCDFIVTSRYHGVVFSHLLEKPVIVLSYQGKSDVVMEPLGLKDYCSGIEQFEVEWLINAFRRLVQSRESIQSREATAVATYGEMLRRQFDELFPPSCPAPNPRSANALA